MFTWTMSKMESLTILFREQLELSNVSIKTDNLIIFTYFYESLLKLYFYQFIINFYISHIIDLCFKHL